MLCEISLTGVSGHHCAIMKTASASVKNLPHRLSELNPKTLLFARLKVNTYICRSLYTLDYVSRRDMCARFPSNNLTTASFRVAGSFPIFQT